MDTRTAIEWQRKYLIPAVGTYYAEPLVISHGNGHYLWDLDGHEYLDFFGGILTVSVGHADPLINGRIVGKCSAWARSFSKRVAISF